jgi:hypothetical protein
MSLTLMAAIEDDFFTMPSVGWVNSQHRTFRSNVYCAVSTRAVSLITGCASQEGAVRASRRRSQRLEQGGPRQRQ